MSTTKPNRMFPGWSEVIEKTPPAPDTTKEQTEAIAKRMQERVMEEDHALDTVLHDMNHQAKKPKPDLPTPEQQPLTPEQRKILTQLPDTPGFYWVENTQTEERNVAYIDKSRAYNTVEHWGHSMDATYGGIGAIDRWFMVYSILGEVTPYKDDTVYEENANFGMF